MVILIAGGLLHYIRAEEKINKSREELAKEISEIEKKIEMMEKTPDYSEAREKLKEAELKYKSFKPKESEDRTAIENELEDLESNLKRATDALSGLQDEIGMTKLEGERLEALEYYNELKKMQEAGGDVPQKDVDEAWAYLEKTDEELQKVRSDERLAALENDVEAIKGKIKDAEDKIIKVQSSSEEEGNLRTNYEQARDKLYSLQKDFGYFDLKARLTKLKKELKTIESSQGLSKKMAMSEKEKKEGKTILLDNPNLSEPAIVKPQLKRDIRSFLEGAAFAILIFFLINLIYRTFKKAEKLSL
jgi:DNA repair exonuclease SbcCD ATPase subunit